ncbi:hypothetical protein H8R18_03360 [Nanchangia anserum]|uniref:DUF3955 domain-containing protein n=1 Tax=Nanchangia anserum TaxID=2692125 RepID=A0A8I0GAJ8_9ACTO|nr:hypothetical protein [Nanchangia anserum]MBD3690179.1 hypothetical protein [Nanchangia anserum]QOX82366.1 hypothetical protein H8R18_03360 [Nanchangia anserum]
MLKKVGIVVACGVFAAVLYCLQAGLGLDLNPGLGRDSIDDEFSALGLVAWTVVGIVVGVVCLVIQHMKNTK